LTQGDQLRTYKLDMTKAQKIPLQHFAIEAVVIVLSILMAFALDASWDSFNERQLEQAILADIAEEMRGNIAALDFAYSRQVTRLEELDQIILEAGPERSGLSADSLKTLLASIMVNPTFDMKNGVLDQLLQAGNLSLIRSTELRTRLSGLHGFMADYQSNQMTPFYITVDPDIFLNTGSILFQHDIVSLPLPDSALGASVPWEDPPTPEQVQALKALAFIRALTQLSILETPAVRNEMIEILRLIDDSQKVRSP
jgi:hypothetical protein